MLLGYFIFFGLSCWACFVGLKNSAPSSFLVGRSDSLSLAWDLFKICSSDIQLYVVAFSFGVPAIAVFCAELVPHFQKWRAGRKRYLV
jgi:hypothetical protein